MALFSDVDTLRKQGLLAEGWQGRLPNDFAPWTSTIVLVVRKGNPLKFTIGPILQDRT